MQVDFEWIDAAGRRNWPVNLGRKLDAGYDVFLIGDLDASALSPQDLGAIVAKVNAGAGIAFLGGFHAFEAGGWGSTVVGQLLPFEADRLARQPFDQPIRCGIADQQAEGGASGRQRFPHLAQEAIARTSVSEEQRQRIEVLGYRAMIVAGKVEQRTVSALRDLAADVDDLGRSYFPGVTIAASAASAQPEASTSSGELLQSAARTHGRRSTRRARATADTRAQLPDMPIDGRQFRTTNR
jgi:hypothetical protein